MPEDPATNPEPTGSQEPTNTQEPPKQQPAAKKATEGNAGLEVMYQEKIDRLHVDLNGVRGKLKTLETERDQLKAQVNEFTVKEKKSTAFTAALSDLGEDFEIASEKLPELNKVVAGLADGEGLEDTIKSLVNAAKTSKTKETQQVGSTPFFGTPPVNKTEGATLAELYQLAATNPEAFKTALKNQ